ncbi:hypothetical protein ACFV0Z_12030 [Streptomyces xiamenensis]|uniref:hypothetical protein n=1 Tax=Streptomyces xiamenensis TaxID=408015 RepID=UPI003698CC3B
MGRPDGSILWDDGTILHPDGRLESPTGQTIQNADEIPAEISARDRSILDSTPDSPPPSHRPDTVPTEGPTRDLPGQRTSDSTPSSPTGGGGGGGGNYPEAPRGGTGDGLPEGPSGGADGPLDGADTSPNGRDGQPDATGHPSEPGSPVREAVEPHRDSQRRLRWQAESDIPGPARGLELREPHPRHTFSGVKHGDVKAENSLVLPEYVSAMRSDIGEIAAGNAHFDRVSQRYEVNGRTYGIEPSGTVFPASGPGILELDRVEYDALKQIARANGDISKIQRMFDNAPKFKNNPEAVARAISLHESYMKK